MNTPDETKSPIPQMPSERKKRSASAMFFSGAEESKIDPQASKKKRSRISSSTSEFMRRYFSSFPSEISGMVADYLPSVHTLLTHVARGEQKEAEALIQDIPALLLFSGDVTDYSERTFRGITAFQYALWAKDWNMWTMIQKHLPREAQVAQLEDWEAHPQHGGYFQFKPLLDTYEVYIDSYDNWNLKQRKHYWCQVIGGYQRMLPAHVVEEYTTPNRPFDPVSDFALRGRMSAHAQYGVRWWFTKAYDECGVLGSGWAFLRRGARAMALGFPPLSLPKLQAILGSSGVKAPV